MKQLRMRRKTGFFRGFKASTNHQKITFSKSLPGKHLHLTLASGHPSLQTLSKHHMKCLVTLQNKLSHYVPIRFKKMEDKIFCIIVFIVIFVVCVHCVIVALSHSTASVQSPFPEARH